MDIQIDSREKPEAIKLILAEFDRKKVHYFKSKLYVGDYQNLDNPRTIQEGTYSRNRSRDTACYPVRARRGNRDNRGCIFLGKPEEA